MNGIETAAFVLGVINVALVVRRSVWNYPFGIVMVSLYAVIFFRAKLYSDAGLQLFFFAVQFWGWWLWSRARADEGEILVERLSDRARVAWAVGCAVAIAGWGAVMHRFTDATHPWWDGSVAILSIAAQIMMSRRQIENWVLWIVVDLLSIGLYAVKGLWLTMVLYGVFLVLACWGLVDWRRVRRGTGPAAA